MERNFRVGNYLNLGQHSIDVQQVTGIYIDTEGWVETGEYLISTDICEGELISDFYAIPLTEQWLIDFGANKDTHGFLYITIGRATFRFLNDEDCFTLRWQSDVGLSWDLLPDVEYVHHLQNLIFALTDQELIKNN